MGRTRVPKLRRGDVDVHARKSGEVGVSVLSEVLRTMGLPPGRAGDGGKKSIGAGRVLDSFDRVGVPTYEVRANERLAWFTFTCKRCGGLMRAGFYSDQKRAVFRECRGCRMCWNLFQDGSMVRDQIEERIRREARRELRREHEGLLEEGGKRDGGEDG